MSQRDPFQPIEVDGFFYTKISTGRLDLSVEGITIKGKIGDVLFIRSPYKIEWEKLDWGEYRLAKKSKCLNCDGQVACCVRNGSGLPILVARSSAVDYKRYSDFIDCTVEPSKFQNEFTLEMCKTKFSVENPLRTDEVVINMIEQNTKADAILENRRFFSSNNNKTIYLAHSLVNFL